MNRVKQPTTSLAVLLSIGEAKLPFNQNRSIRHLKLPDELDIELNLRLDYAYPILKVSTVGDRNLQDIAIYFSVYYQP